MRDIPRSRLVVRLLQARDESDYEPNDNENHRDKPEDLPEAPRPLARNFSTTSIDEDVEELLLIAIIRDP